VLSHTPPRQCMQLQTRTRPSVQQPVFTSDQNLASIANREVTHDAPANHGWHLLSGLDATWPTYWSHISAAARTLSSAATPQGGRLLRHQTPCCIAQPGDHCRLPHSLPSTKVLGYLQVRAGTTEPSSWSAPCQPRSKHHVWVLTGCVVQHALKPAHSQLAQRSQ
jgi:hypothetical protein